MKKLYYAIAMMAFIMTSCAVNKDNEPYYAEVTFQGELPVTKASIGGVEGDKHPVSWSSGDKVWIFRTGAGGEFSATSSEIKTTFSKTLWHNQADYDNFVAGESSIEFCAFYPYCEANSTGPEDGKHANYLNSLNRYVMINLPVVQTAVKDGIDPAALVMSGKTVGIANPIQFHNAVALLEFSFIAPQGINVSSVKIETTYLSQGIVGNAPVYERQTALTYGELAGTKSMYCPDASSYIFGSEKHSNSVTLKDSGKALEPGAKYYVSVWPGKKTGFKVTLVGTDADGNSVSFIRKSKIDLEFSRSVVYPLGTIGSTDASVWTK